jgi:hypothetical protein
MAREAASARSLSDPRVPSQGLAADGSDLGIGQEARGVRERCEDVVLRDATLGHQRFGRLATSELTDHEGNGHARPRDDGLSEQAAEVATLSVPCVYQNVLEARRDIVQDGVRCLPARRFLAALA